MTFVLWPNRQDKLQVFLQHLNSLHSNIQFTIEIKKDGKLTLLDVLVEHVSDGSLRHSVYCKTIHTLIYDYNLLTATIWHSLMECLTLCYIEHTRNLKTELEHLETVFRKNGYGNRHIQRAFKQQKCSRCQYEEQTKEENKA